MKICIFSVPTRAMVLFRVSALSLAVVAAFPSHAQSQLKETVVTATRSESRAEAVISDVSTISREDIERGTGRTLPELIARVSGVQMSANGGLGNNSGIFIRGTESRHVLLLVDGVRYGSATAGAANFDNIPLESIERIEVLKGPASALYGSDAVGGVIQVFTRKGTPGLHPYASVTVGGDERQEVAAGLSGGTADVTYSLGLQNLREKGFSATNPLVAFGGFNADTDGFTQNTVNASLDWKFAPGWKADARVLQADGVSHFDNGPGVFDARTDSVSSVYGLGVEGQLRSNWKTRLVFGTSEDRSTSWSRATPDQFNTLQDQWTWLNEFGTSLGTVLVGFERVVQKVSGSQAYAVSERTTDSWLAGLNGAAGPHSWQLNVRRDQESQFGDATTGLAGYGFKVTPHWRAFGSYGTSFKAPSFNTLYYVSPFFNGNPTTQPEYGRNSEFGMAYNSGAHEIKLTYFVNRIKGFITTAPVVANIPYARIEGWTLAYEGQIDAFTYRAALDLLDARNEANNLKLPRRADQQLTAGIDYAFGAWKLGTSLLAASDRFDNATNTRPLAGYATVDIHADYAVSKDWSVEGRVNNMGDKAYMTAYGYNQAGRSAYITLRYQPK
jgi:vitamin B12 transporter